MIRLLLLSIFSTSLFAAECPIFYNVERDTEFFAPYYQEATINVCNIRMAEKIDTHEGLHKTTFHFDIGGSVSFYGHDIYDAIEPIRLSATNTDCSILLRVEKPEELVRDNPDTGLILFDACNINMYYVRTSPHAPGDNVVRTQVFGMPFDLVDGETFYEDLNRVLSTFIYTPTGQ